MLRQVRPEVRPVEVGDLPGRDRQRDRDRLRLPGAVVDDDDPICTGLRGSQRLRHERAMAARHQGNRTAQRPGQERCLRLVVGIVVGAAKAAVERLAVRRRERADVDQQPRLLRERRGEELAAGAGDRDPADGRRRVSVGDAERGREHVRVRHRRDRDRVGRRAR